MAVVGAIALLGVLLTPMQRISLDRQTVLTSSEALSTTTAVGQELMEEILVRKFDASVTLTPADSALRLSNFALPASLGPESGTTDTAGRITTYNDVDDFNGYADSVATPRIGSVRDTVKISYVDTLSPYGIVNYRTWFKRIDVKVWNKYLPTQAASPTSITISKIICYRYKK